MSSLRKDEPPPVKKAGNLLDSEIASVIHDSITAIGGSDERNRNSYSARYLECPSSSAKATGVGEVEKLCFHRFVFLFENAQGR